ncbi:hypothetical protein [Qipengyuania psychrotolerans]|uniref:DUF2268 domain-containing protein n=1 Tax=Qipengyuania psychrotolerans TaxID=2867238 RepID=A0ABX8ZEW0_9SPHN|nr:hypothetical protein [Qipengyuania psychrotolerans]QZD86278.1 hypothetical protein K3166_08390 [Qipengyuania psychrotolerans]
MMARLLIAVAVLLLTPFKAHANVMVTVSYRETADLFSTMDNMSDWLPGNTIPAYRKEWEARFGWTEADQQWVDSYKEYRRRTILKGQTSPNPRSSPDGIFASRDQLTAASDPLAAHFLEHTTIEAALASFEGAASVGDAKMLRGFYRHFKPKWRLLLADSSALQQRASKLHARLKSLAAADFIASIAKFYRSDLDGEFTVLFTRRPPGDVASAEPIAGSFILLQSPPTETDPSYWDTIVFHELVHFISSRQPIAQKQALTARFFARCPAPPRINWGWFVEEPLAVAWGQAAYSSKVLRSPLDPKENWYADPWVNLVSRTLAPTIIDQYDRGSDIEDLVDQAADRCIDLMSVIGSQQKR